MADRKISVLVAASALDGTELLVLVQPAADPKDNKKITVNALMAKAPVQSVNGLTGVVVLNAASVGAVAAGANISVFTNDVGYITTLSQLSMATAKILGRTTAGSGAIEQLNVSGGIELIAGAIQSSAYTGDVTKTAGGTALTIANDAVTFSKMQNSGASGLSVVGRSANTQGDFGEIAAGTDSHVLRRSGTTLGFGQIGDASISGVDWSKVSGRPTTLSGYGITDASPLAGSVNIVTVGTITTGVWSATAIGPTKGGTGLIAYTTGDLIQATATNTLSALAAVATGNALISGGIGAASAWGKIGLTTHVTGVLPVANGGINISSYTIGDLLVATGVTTLSKLADVATGNALISGGVGVAPLYGKITSGHVDSTVLVTTGAQTITGAKTFSVAPIFTWAGTFRIPFTDGANTYSVSTGLQYNGSGLILNEANITASAASAVPFTVFDNVSQPILSIAIVGGVRQVFLNVGSDVQGDLLQRNNTGFLQRLAAVATGNVLLSGGVSTLSSWGKVGLSTHVTGILPIDHFPGYTTEEVIGTTYLFTEADRYKVKWFTNVLGCTATIPTGLTLGWNVTAYRGDGAGTLTIASAGTLESISTTLELPKTLATIYHRGSNIHVAGGALGAAGGSGVSGLSVTRIPFAASPTTLADSADLTWDNFNAAITIGSSRIHSTGAGNFFAGDNAGNFTLSGVGANTGIGFEVLDALTTGSENTALGFSSLGAATTGIGNTAIGVTAGRDLTTGAANIFLGRGAGVNITTGGSNLAIGHVDLPSNTASGQMSIMNAIFGVSNANTGTTVSVGNIGIYVVNPSARLHLPAGSAASGQAPMKMTTGTALTTPEDGVFEYHSNHLYFTIGSTRFQIDQQSGGGGGGVSGLTAPRIPFATTPTTLGDDANLQWDNTNKFLTVGNARIFTNAGTNLFIGNLAGIFSASGANNIGVGYQTLTALSSGSSNTALGTNALFALTTAQGNTAIGTSALRSNLIGASNTALGNLALELATSGFNTGIGRDSLKLVSTGQGNTALGYAAGGNITTGGLNVVIGQGVDAPSATANAQLSIQNIIFGTGNGGIGVAVSTGNVGIGTPSPDVRFHVEVTNDVLDVTNVLRLTKVRTASTGHTAANGVGMEFEVETADANNEIGASIHAVIKDITTNTESFYLVFRTMMQGVGPTDMVKIGGTTGDVGIGNGLANPARRLHVYTDDAFNSTVVQVLRLTHDTQGIAVAGIGAGIEFQVECETVSRLGAHIDIVSTTITNGSESFDIVLRMMGAGVTSTEKIRFKSSGDVLLKNATSVPGSNPVDAFLVYSADISAGVASPHFRNEMGDIIKLYTVNRGSGYTTTNVTTDRAIDANSTTIDEIADVLSTLITDLKLTGLIV